MWGLKSIILELVLFYKYFVAAKRKTRDSSVGRAVDCRGNINPSVTGSIPVRENFLHIVSLVHSLTHAYIMMGRLYLVCYVPSNTNVLAQI